MNARDPKFTIFGEWLLNQGYKSTTISTIIYQVKKTLEYKTPYEREQFLQIAPAPFTSNYKKWCRYAEITPWCEFNFPLEIIQAIQSLIRDVGIPINELPELKISFPLSMIGDNIVVIRRGDYRPIRPQQNMWLIPFATLISIKNYFFQEKNEGNYPLVPFDLDQNDKPMLAKMLKRIRKL